MDFLIEHPKGKPTGKHVEKCIRKPFMKKSLFIRARAFVKLSIEAHHLSSMWF